jgi:hypothetical protein
MAKSTGRERGGFLDAPFVQGGDSLIGQWRDVTRRGRHPLQADVLTATTNRPQTAAARTQTRINLRGFLHTHRETFPRVSQPP